MNKKIKFIGVKMQRKLKSTKNVTLAISILLFLVSFEIVQTCVEFLQVEALEKHIQHRNKLWNSKLRIKDHHIGKTFFFTSSMID